MFQWIGQNKEWIFSGGGISIILLVVWALRRVFRGNSEPEPVVDVTMGMARFGNNLIDFLGIEFKNKSNRDIIVGNFVLEMWSGETMFTTHDEITGQPQQKWTVRRGDSFTFHIPVAMLAKAGRTIAEYKCALVTDALGNKYRSDSKKLTRTIASLLLVKH